MDLNVEKTENVGVEESTEAVEKLFSSARNKGKVQVKATSSEINLDDPLHGVKTIIREVVAEGVNVEGAWGVLATDAYVASYLNAGWTLHSVHFAGRKIVGQPPTDAFGMVYVLVR